MNRYEVALLAVGTFGAITGASVLLTNPPQSEVRAERPEPVKRDRVAVSLGDGTFGYSGVNLRAELLDLDGDQGLDVVEIRRDRNIYPLVVFVEKGFEGRYNNPPTIVYPLGDFLRPDARNAFDSGIGLENALRRERWLHQVIEQE